MADSYKFAPSDYLSPDEVQRAAVTLRTRTPIIFKKFSDPDESGSYTRPNLLSVLLTLPKIADSIKPKGTIQVDPYSPDANTQDMGTLINHEEIHSLLQGLDPFQDKIKIDPDQLKAVTPFLQNRQGDLNWEAPAYTGAYNPNVTPMPQDVRDAFVKSMTAKIAQASQQGAQIYQRIASKNSPKGN